jgi:hypothetical protein
LVNKGDVSTASSFNLFFTKEGVEFDLGNGTYLTTMEANVLNPWDIDYHIKSKYGHWNGNTWVNDLVSSPCLDGGYIYSDYSLEPTPNGNVVNIGVYGNTTEASKSGFANLQENNTVDFPIYPNPTTNKINILSEFIGSEYYIYSISGNLILKGVLKVNTIDVSTLSNGVYYIKVKQPNSYDWKTGKVVKI